MNSPLNQLPKFIDSETGIAVFGELLGLNAIATEKTARIILSLHNFMMADGLSVKAIGTSKSRMVAVVSSGGQIRFNFDLIEQEFAT